MFKRILIGLATVFTILIIFVIGYRMYWNVSSSQQLLSKMDSKFKKNRGQKEAILLIENTDGTKGHLITNQMDESQNIMLASITKLYTHSVIYSLVDKNLLDLSKPLSFYLDESLIQGIHQIKGMDYSQQITLQMLVDQNSGISDYEMDFKGEKSIVDKLKTEDFTLNEHDAIEFTRDLDGRFFPGENKGHYSNLNAILLGLTAEKVTGKSLIELYDQYIFKPLNLTNTQIITKDNVVIPYLKDQPANRYLYGSSALDCGGLVSDVKELMIFLKAFHQGKLFDKSHLENPYFNSIQFFPLKYGAGMMSVEMAWYLSPLIDAPLILGHSGLSGSFAFYCPSKDLYIVGSLNEYEANPFPWIYQYLSAMKS